MRLLVIAFLLVFFSGLVSASGCPPGASDCFSCCGVPCKNDCIGIYSKLAGQYVKCECPQGKSPQCYCPYTGGGTKTTIGVTTIPTQPKHPTTTEKPMKPESGNSKCERSIGENCQTSGDCTCLGGQTCDPKNPKANPSGCVSPADAIKCPENSAAYGAQCYCKEGFEWNLAKTVCVMKKTCDPPLKMVDGKCICNNQQCDTVKGENCVNCPEDCKCGKDQLCYAQVVYPQIKSAVDEKLCLDCVKYCIARFGEHALFTKMSGGSCGCECDLGYEWTDDYKSCVEKKIAYVFISKDMSWRHTLFSVPKQQHIKKFFKQKGYDVRVKYVNNRSDMLKDMADPATKAIAYFGHGTGPDSNWDYMTGKEKVEPTMEGFNKAKDYLDNGKDALRDQYVDMGLPYDEAKKKAEEKFNDNSFNYDYAYIHACYSYDDKSLADGLVKPGGTFWGDTGKLNPWQTLYEYKKPGGEE